LPEILAQEREAIAKYAGKVTAILAEYGYDTENPSETWLTFCRDLTELRATERQNLDVYAPDFAALQNGGAFRENAAVWAKTLQQALEISASSDATEVILFAPNDLLALVDAAEKARTYLQILSRELDGQEKGLRAEGDSLALHQEVLGLLTELTTMVRGEKDSDDAD
jgi:imidazolonepropionase-like amidohydrolase